MVVLKNALPHACIWRLMSGGLFLQILAPGGGELQHCSWQIVAVQRGEGTDLLSGSVPHIRVTRAITGAKRTCCCVCSAI